MFCFTTNFIFAAVVTSLVVTVSGQQSNIIASCDFEASSDDNISAWCGFNQSQTVGDLLWGVEVENEDGVAVARVNNSGTHGKARLLSPNYQLTTRSETSSQTVRLGQQACLSLMYKFTGSGLGLLHVIANVFSSQNSHNTQWYTREQSALNEWKEVFMNIKSDFKENQTETGDLYLRIILDVTSKPYGYGEIQIDNILVDDRAVCSMDEANEESTYAINADGQLHDSVKPAQPAAESDSVKPVQPVVENSELPLKTQTQLEIETETKRPETLLTISADSNQ